MKLLIFDTILNGHHSDYIGHLVHHWYSKQLPGELYVVTPAGLAASLPTKYPADSGIHFVELNDAEVRESQNAGPVQRSFADWNLYIKQAERIKPTHALLMYADIFQLGLWLGKKSPCPVSGIYFRPSFGTNVAAGWRGKLVEFRKKFLLGRMLTNPTLSTIFLLDHAAVPAVQKLTNSVKILPLPDPVRRHPEAPERVNALRNTLDIGPNRKIFLLFGHLDDRKGIEPTMDALQLLSKEDSGKVTFIMAGPMADDYRGIIEARIKVLNTEAQILGPLKRIEESAIRDFFDLTDYVLTLYQRHVGMSSVVVRAALSRKPLISSDYGYMGHLVASKELGATLNSESPVAIQRAFEEALRGEVQASESTMKKLADDNTVEAFANMLFQAMETKP